VCFSLSSNFSKVIIYFVTVAIRYIKSNQILFVRQRDQAAVIINAMLNRNDKAMKALTVTLM